MSGSISPRHALWRVLPLSTSTPTLTRHCPRCDDEREFISSERFRVNANKRLLDVWLVYRCARCERSWNQTIFERKNVSEFDRGLLQRLHANDPALAKELARTVSAARRASRAEATRDFRLEGALFAEEIRFCVPEPVAARLDRVLARGLRCSRSEVAHLAPARALRRPVVDGMRVRLLRTSAS